MPKLTMNYEALTVMLAMAGVVLWGANKKRTRSDRRRGGRRHGPGVWSPMDGGDGPPIVFHNDHHAGDGYAHDAGDLGGDDIGGHDAGGFDGGADDGGVGPH